MLYANSGAGNYAGGGYSGRVGTAGGGFGQGQAFAAGAGGHGAGFRSGAQGGDACGCDDACGAGGGGCGTGGAGCGTSYDTTGVLSYVGAGGDYKQETTYRYVGQGAGDFEMVGVPTNFRGNICLCIIPLLLLLLLVPLALLLLPQLSTSDPVVTTTVLASTP